jgi:hypothetical protein
MEGLGRGPWWMAAIGQSLADLATGWQLPAFENANLPLGLPAKNCQSGLVGWAFIRGDCGGYALELNDDTPLHFVAFESHQGKAAGQEATSEGLDCPPAISA